MAGQLVLVDQIDTFKDVRDFPFPDISPNVVKAVRVLDEKEELEPFLRSILSDQNETPHGPAEVVDILTHKVSYNGTHGLAGFILKGKSFPTVRPKNVSHQIYRLEKIVGLKYAFLGVTGILLDQAQEQFVSTAERLGCTYCILDAADLARMFVAYGFFCPRDGNRIAAGRCSCGYSPKKRLLNILQKQSLDELSHAHALKQTAGLIVLPPGTGKTRIAAEDAHKSGARRVLYVAHTHEIIDVAESEFAAVFGAEQVKRLTVRQPLTQLKAVNLATIQFLSNQPNVFREGVFDYIVVDEFHHAAAPSYKRLLDASTSPFLLGLTATPFRGDRQDIMELCGGNVLVNAELRTGIDEGILAPYHYFGAFDDVDYSRIEHKGVAYSIRDLERSLIIPARDRAIIKKWREHADQKPTLAFCCTQKHALRVVESFRAAGITAEPYLADTPLDKRKRIAAQLERGKTKVLCVVDVVNEGADFPYVECLLFLRPTESKRIFFQQLGRGLRKYVGKSHCIVIDFIGNFRNAHRIVEYHGLFPDANEQPTTALSHTRTTKELLNLPLGCEVHFDEKVIDVFTQQAFDPRYATRFNIGRILLYQYQRLERKLSRKPSRRDVDRNCMLASNFYVDVFGSWHKFERVLAHDIA